MDVNSEREYNRQQDRLFILQAFLTVVVLAVYFFSGASMRLAVGLRTSFGDLWPLVNLIFIGVTVFGYAVFMFPLVYYSDYVLEVEHGLQTEAFGVWLTSYIRGLLIDLAVACVVFSIVYAFLRFSPEWWWALIALLYMLFVVIMDVVLPAVLSPLIRPGHSLPDRDRARRFLDWARKLGLDARGIEMCGTDDLRSAAPVMLAGIGKGRTILVDKSVLNEFTDGEIEALLAQEISLMKMGVKKKFMTLYVLVAAGGLFLANHALEFAIAGLMAFEIESLYDIAGFPILLGTLFAFVMICAPALNYLSHRKVFQADAFAVNACESADDVVNAIEKESAASVVHSNPAGWMEILFHRVPSTKRRIENVRAAGDQL